MTQMPSDTPDDFFRQFGRGRYRAGSVLVLETSFLPLAEAVRDLVEADWRGAVGWLCFTDTVCAARAAGDLPDLNGRFVLSGELALQGRSLHLRRQGAGWRAAVMTTREGGQGLLETVSLLAVDQGPPLLYEVGWSTAPPADPVLPTAYEASVARFLGFANV